MSRWTFFFVFVLGTAALHPVAARQRPSTGSSAISGVVVDAVTGHPIAGAEAYLGIANYGPVNSQSRQLTDAKGRFVYVNLPASDAFFMNVSKAGYITGHLGETKPSANSLSGGNLKLTDGQWIDDVKIQLWRAGAIGGTVLDERGEPVVGASVTLVMRVPIGGRPHLVSGAGATTDDRGRYRITELMPGDYFVQVPSVQTAVPASTPALTVEGLTPETARQQDDSRRPLNNGALDGDGRTSLIIGNYPTASHAAGAPQAYGQTFAPGVPSLDAASAVTLAPGEVRDGVDIVLRPSPVVTVSGRIEGGGTATRGMVLRLMAKGLEDLGEGSETATTVVAPDNSFAFLNVPAGDYTVIASRSSLQYRTSTAFAPTGDVPGTPGWLPGPGTFLGGIASGPGGTRASGRHAVGDLSYWARVPVSVGGADVTGVAIPMNRTWSLRGRIAWDGAGAPPAQVAIFLEPANGDPSLGMGQSTTRPSFDGDDTFTVNGLLPGAYLLRVLGIGPKQALKSVSRGARDFGLQAIDGSSNQDMDGVVVTLTDRIASIAGTVDAGKASPSLYRVIAFPADRDAWANYGLSAPRFKSVSVNNSGAYRIDNIPAGRYQLVAVDSGDVTAWQDTAFLERVAQFAPAVTVGWGEAKTQDLKVGGGK